MIIKTGVVNNQWNCESKRMTRFGFSEEKSFILLYTVKYQLKFPLINKNQIQTKSQAQFMLNQAVDICLHN